MNAGVWEKRMGYWGWLWMWVTRRGSASGWTDFLPLSCWVGAKGVGSVTSQHSLCGGAALSGALKNLRVWSQRFLSSSDQPLPPASHMAGKPPKRTITILCLPLLLLLSPLPSCRSSPFLPAAIGPVPSAPSRRRSAEETMGDQRRGGGGGRGWR